MLPFRAAVRLDQQSSDSASLGHLQIFSVCDQVHYVREMLQDPYQESELRAHPLWDGSKERGSVFPASNKPPAGRQRTAGTSPQPLW